MRRIDRAAADMSPHLLVLAMGLLVLYLACLGFMAMHFKVTYSPPGGGSCVAAQTAAAAPELRAGQ